MKILCYGDLHVRELGSFQPYTKINEATGLTLELENTIRGSEFIASCIAIEKPDFVVDLGDFFHEKSNASTKTLYAGSVCANNITQAARNVSAKCVMLAGNHGYLDESNGINNFDILSGYYEVYKQPQVIKMGDLAVGIIPFCSDKFHTSSFLDQYKAECDLILTHLEFQGCVFDSGLVTKEGYNPFLGVPCVSGHIHVAQTIGDVMYPGSVIQHTFSRCDIDKIGGALVLEFEGNKLVSTKHFENDKSVHYLKVVSPDYLFDNTDSLYGKVVSKVMVDEDVYKNHKLTFDKFDHVFFPVKTREFNPIRVSTNSDSDNNSGEQVGLLRNYIVENHPEAIATFDKVIDGN